MNFQMNRLKQSENHCGASGLHAVVQVVFEVLALNGSTNEGPRAEQKNQSIVGGISVDAMTADTAWQRNGASAIATSFSSERARV